MTFSGGKGSDNIDLTTNRCAYLESDEHLSAGVHGLHSAVHNGNKWTSSCCSNVRCNSGNHVLVCNMFPLKPEPDGSHMFAKAEKKSRKYLIFMLEDD